jgi:tetratricopeptide (TPR) repeat protein
VKKWTIPLVAAAVALVIVTATLLLPDRGGDPIDVQPADHALRAGIELFGRRDYEAAIDMLKQVPEGSEFEATARYYEGSAQLMLRNVDTAFAILQQAQLLAPDDPHILYALGVASFRNGNLKLAKGYFTSVLNIPPVDENDRELHKQAKGLLDSLAGMERRQAEQVDSTPDAEDQPGTGD